MSKLSNLIDNDVVKKTFYDQLVSKADTIDTSEFVLKTQYQTEKSSPEKKLMAQIKKSLILASFY